MKVYRKNEKMDFIRTDEYATAVFDPDSGCTHLVNDTGTGILDALDEPCNIRELVARLCKSYSANPEDIRLDVESFLKDMTSKGVVLTK